MRTKTKRYTVNRHKNDVGVMLHKRSNIEIVRKKWIQVLQRKNVLKAVSFKNYLAKSYDIKNLYTSALFKTWRKYGS